MRVFAGIALPEEVRLRLASLQSTLPIGRAVAPDNMHVTLAFLDEQHPSVLETVHEAFEGLSFTPFPLEIRGVGVFGDGTPRQVFADVTATASLMQLRKRIRSAVHGAGVVLPKSRFHPHVTLRRISKSADQADPGRIADFLSGYAGFALPAFEVSSFALFQSTLRPDGARYDILAQYPAN